MAKKSNLISEYYQCQTCESKPEFTSTKEIVAHAKEFHNVEEGCVGYSTMILHTDCAREYSYTNLIEFGEMKAIQKLTFKRDKSSLMYH